MVWCGVVWQCGRECTLVDSAGRWSGKHVMLTSGCLFAQPPAPAAVEVHGAPTQHHPCPTDGFTNQYQHQYQHQHQHNLLMATPTSIARLRVQQPERDGNLGGQAPQVVKG